jgi:hypothetical protein
MNEEWVEECTEIAYTYQCQLALLMMQRIDLTVPAFPDWKDIREDHKEAWRATVRLVIEKYMEHHLAPESPDVPTFVCNKHGWASNFMPCQRGSCHTLFG